MTRRPRQAKTAATAQIAKPKPAFKISDSLLARAGARGNTATAFDHNPFGLGQHPPGVVPAGSPKMAMDDFGGSLGWAQNAMTGMSFEGQHFIGYPELALLAQIPEYRRPSEIIATEMTRKWIKIVSAGDKDKTKKVARLGVAMKQLNVQDVFCRAAMQDMLYGRGHIYLDLDTTDDPGELKTPIGDGKDKASLAKIGKGDLKALKTVEAVWCYPANYNSNDPLKSNWYRPDAWFVQGKEIHASRFLTFVGREVPDLLKPAYSFGGLSLSQMLKVSVDNWLRTRRGVADIINAFSVFVLKTNLAEAVAMGGDGEQVFKRAELFNKFRDNRRLFMLDKDAEDFFNVSASLGGLDALQAQTQEHMAAVCGIPLVKLLGIQPAGLNASSEGELECFYTWIHSQQESFFTPNLKKVIDFIQLSEFGEIDEDIGFEYEPLDALDETELAAIRKIEAE